MSLAKTVCGKKQKRKKICSEEHVIPKLKDHDYLSKLPKGTVGECCFTELQKILE